MTTSPNGPLRILHYLNAVRLEYGGVVRSVIDLCTTLAARGHDVVLATSDTKDIPAAWRHASHAGPGARVPKFVKVSSLDTAGSKMRSLVGDTAVVHLHGPWEPRNLAIARIARSLGKPYIVTAHGMLDDWSMAQKALKKRLYHMFIAKRFLDQAAFVHCSAAGEATQVQRWLGRGRTFVISNVIDFSPFASLPGEGVAQTRYPFLKDKRLKLLFLSRIHYKKGLEALIDAAHLLGTQGQDLTLVVAGPGETRYLKRVRARIRRLGLESQVRLIGLVTGPEKISLYQACDLMVLPTSQENFGLVLVESMASGTPVLTTRGTDIWREIQAGGGFICEPTPTAIAESVRDLARDLDALAARGQQGRHWVFDFFAVDRLLAEYEALYTQSITGSQ